MTGNAGCNNYSGTLTPVNDYFTVGPILTTRQFCGEPAGVMDQAQDYLTALEATGGYQWEQSRLENSALVTQGQLFYNLQSGTTGVMNLTTSP